MSAPATSSRGWLFGPGPDLLLGCGAAYLALVGFHAAFGESLAQSVPGGVLILLFSLPHYGATLLRVYDSSADRSRYRFFALHSTLALVAVLAVSLHTALLGSLVLTLYLTWSPWHYTGQNYGIALMLLARRGVGVTPSTKRWIRVSFVASYGLAFLAMHGAQPGATYAPVIYAGASIQMLPLGIPYGLAAALMVGLIGIYAVALGVSLVQLLRAGSTRAIAPAALLVFTQAVWFSLPVMLRLSGAIAEAPGAASPFSAYGFLWVASAHAVQYLWITVYYATTSGSGEGKLAFLGRAALAGFAVWIVPGLVFAPALLGSVSYDSGLALLIASIVNLHHFVLDGAIWKLRDGRVARVLLRSTAVEGEALAAAGPSLVRRGITVVGAASVAVALFACWESEFGFRRALAAGNLDRAERAIERFAWIGRDGAPKRIEVARSYASRGDFDRASVQLDQALVLETSARGRHLLGLVREQQGRWSEALVEYEKARAIDPLRRGTLERRAGVYIELGDPARALSELERIVAREPKNESARVLLVRARIAVRAQQHTGALE